MRGFLYLLVCLTGIAQADIAINNEQLSINNGLYDISQDLGQIVGGNLFHTFDSFNLNQGEIAQFSGSDSIQNIVSRVIGGEASFINGTIRSTIPNADFYFLNPYGIVFGEYAQLDLQGSFHASTADYLKLSDGGEFHARFPERDILSVAPVESFGFLNVPAAIQTHNSRLTVPEGETLSLVAGDLQLRSDTPVIFDEDNSVAVDAGSVFSAPSGQINLISQGADSSFSLHAAEVSGNGGDIELRNTLVDISGEGGGTIQVQGGDLSMYDASLQANTLGARDGHAIEIDMDGDILLQNTSRSIFKNVLSYTFGSGAADGVRIHAKDMYLSQSFVTSVSFTEAKVGDVEIHANNLTLDAGIIALVATGKTGQMVLKVQDQLKLTGVFSTDISNGNSLEDRPSGINIINFGAQDGLKAFIQAGRIVSESGAIGSVGYGAGAAADIEIQAEHLTLSQGAIVNASAVGTGKGGNIRLQIQDTLHLSGQREGGDFMPKDEDIDLTTNPSAISSVSLNAGGGSVLIDAPQIQLEQSAFITAATLGGDEAGGHINIRAERIQLDSGGQINNSNGGYGNGDYANLSYLSGPGVGGDIEIDTGRLDISGANSGVFCDTYNQGTGGDLLLQTDTLNLQDQGAISARAFGDGDAGQIHIQAEDVHLQSQSEISTQAAQSGGGIIEINVNDLVLLEQGKVTTSVQDGTGNGGGLTINDAQFLVMNDAQIIAQAYEGQGGNIRIVANQFLKSPLSLVSASSRLGIDGNIEITSPDETITSGLHTLSKNFSEQAQIKDACKIAIAGQLPMEFQPPLTFKVNMYRFPNDFIDDWIPSAASRLRLSTCK